MFLAKQFLFVMLALVTYSKLCMPNCCSVHR